MTSKPASPLVIPQERMRQNSIIGFKSPRALLEANCSSGSLTIPDIYDWHAENNPEYPLFIYNDEDNGKEVLKTIYWKDAIRGIHRAANYVFTQTQDGGIKNDLRSPPMVIAVLAQSDTITYSCFLLGIIRSGHTAFPISPRNSPEAIAHLLMKTKASFVFIGNDPGIRSIAKAALQRVQEQKGESFDGPTTELLLMPTFEDMFPCNEKAFELFPQIKYSMEATALIMHSSGSTAFPKPISWSHRAFAKWSLCPFYGALDFEGMIVSCHAMPVYHGIGVVQFVVAASTGYIMSTFKPSLPPVFPTPDRVFEELVKTQCQFGQFVPMFVEYWARDPKKVEYMKTMKRVVFGGGPLSKEVGDRLVREGVALCSCYGATEIGFISPFIQENPGVDWEYIEISGHLDFVYEPRDDGLFELVVLTTERSEQPRVINTEVNGRGAYATNDLFLPHPTKSHYWKVYGRADDQIMLSTGEKTNPGPLERILEQDPHIRNAVMFGRGKIYNGVLVDPKPEFAFDPNAEDGEILLEQFRNMIWPTVERMNAFAPQHSRLFKEMIIVTSPNKPFSYTAKGTVRRPAMIKEYDPEIEALYQRIDQISNIDIYGDVQTGAATIQWNFHSMLEFVRKVVLNVLEKSVRDEDDIFQYGCDSLQATWIRLQISGMLRRTNPEVAHRLPSQFVFQAPSILSLTNLILKYINSNSSPKAQYYSGSNKDPEEEAHIHNVIATVEKFTVDIPSSSGDQSPQVLQVNRKDEGEIILLTGTTGGLGCNMLAHLSRDPTVTRIYALNRTAKGSDLNSHSKISLEERQLEAMKRRGLEDECLLSKVVLVEADLSKPQFGLSFELYEELKNSVTHIIHNAWPVDFNLSLFSFEGAIQGVRNLVDFALGSPYTEPPRILFVSSIGVFKNPSTPGPATEEPILDPAIVVGSGYGEAKWISERILASASEKTGLKTTSVRIGQLAGDKSGHWNEREWFPSIVKSGIFTECLPNVPGEGLVTWLPTYDAARILIQMRYSDEPILHLVNSHPVPWRTIVQAIANEIRVPLVPYEDWLTKLRDSLSESVLSEVENMDQNPALKLLEFYQSATFGEGKDEPLGVVRLDISKAKRTVPALEDVKLDLCIVDKNPLEFINNRIKKLKHDEFTHAQSRISITLWHPTFRRILLLSFEVLCRVGIRFDNHWSPSKYLSALSNFLLGPERTSYTVGFCYSIALCKHSL
ncbi:Adenylate-forming Reductase [Abortiporus biennis]